MRALRPQLPQKPHLKPERRKALQFLARRPRGAMEDNSWLLGRLITFCVGVAVAFAVARQSYGDIARQIVATSYEQVSSIMRPRTAPARIDFGTARLGGTPATLEPSMFEPQEPDSAVAAANMEAPFQAPRNETIAAKGQVTGKDHRPMSPAERLGLIGAARAKHERCLADAVYFEARAEPVRGQMAVAQVVINRVFSGYYPNNICGVVYQNAHRHLRCQFTFACDGRPERVNEPAAWERAQHIARDALDGDSWLNDVGKATHYRARWVHPRWVRKMRKLDRIGVHTFYRPRNWGDGSNSPVEATTTAGKAP